MTIKDKAKESNQAIIFILTIFLTLFLSIGLSFLTLHFAESTSTVVGDMVTFVYGVGTIIVGLITIATYIGTAAIVGIGITAMFEKADKSGSKRC